MTVHAFVDESERNGTYLLCAAIVEPRWLTPLRKQVSRLLLPGQRELHFAKEKPPRRRILADRIAQLPVTVTVYSATSTRRTAEAARQRCLRQLVSDLCDLRALRLVLDSREDRDQHDKVTIIRTLADGPWRDELAYEHLTSTCDPLMWIADVAGWCYGADRDWRRRIMPIIGKVIEA